MRLWTINFKYLDAKGLVALWREALLAKNVLKGLTKGYKNHPQLIRFYTHQNSIDAINAYLLEVYKEACVRGYKFDVAKVGKFDAENLSKIAVTRGQIEYEFSFLQEKLKQRDLKKYKENLNVKNIEISTIFTKIDGDIEPWEKPKNAYLVFILQIFLTISILFISSNLILVFTIMRVLSLKFTSETSPPDLT